MSLERVYGVLLRDGLVYTVVYWLAVPLLLLLYVLGGRVEDVSQFCRVDCGGGASRFERV